jgi:hypothetical protein
MRREKEPVAQTPEQKRFAREVFEAGREVALRGIPAESHEYSWGILERTTFLGVYQGGKYSIEYSISHNKEGLDSYKVAVIGRDLCLEVKTGTFEDCVLLTGYSKANIDPKDLLANLISVNDLPKDASVEEDKKTVKRKVFRLDTNEGPGGILIEADNEQEAEKKYLDWCEKNGYFDAIYFYRKYFHSFAVSSLIS